MRSTLPLVLLAVPVLAAGCDPGMKVIDKRVEAMLLDESGDLGPPDQAAPARNRVEGYGASADRGWPASDRELSEQPPSDNPTAEELILIAEPEMDAEQLVERLRGYSSDRPDAVHLDLTAALAYAMENSREFRGAEEDYILACLSLLIEQHRWGPRFFDDVSATVFGSGRAGTYDSTLRVVNDLQVTQRLPYGGEVAVQFLASATEDLASRVAFPGQSFQSADVLFTADIPLLRGAGTIAREDLIQSYRNVVYAARSFERFRREFLFDISVEFLDLVVRQQGLVNAERQVESLRLVQAREEALVEAGRQRPYEAAFAAQETLFAIDNLNSLLENYRLGVDSFKVRIGMSESQPLVIDRSSYDLPAPDISLDGAVIRALSYRLDLQNTRDRVDDARRGVSNAENLLLPDLDFSGSAGYAGANGSASGEDDLSYSAGITLGLPLDRTIERVGVRQAQITLERSVRDYSRARDTVAVEVRSTLRSIDRALLSLDLQEDNIENAQIRQESIEAAPERATTRDRLEATNQYLAALDARDEAARDVQVTILRYLLDSGQLRVDRQGRILLPTELPAGPPEEPEPAAKEDSDPA